MFGQSGKHAWSHTCTLLALANIAVKQSSDSNQQCEATSFIPLPTNRQRASLHGCCSVQPCQHAAIRSISAGSCAGVWSLIAHGCIHQTSRPANLSAATPLATKPATAGGCTKSVGSSTGANFDSDWVKVARLWAIMSMMSIGLSITVCGLCHNSGALKATLSALNKYGLWLPVPDTHCQLRWLLAKSPSIKWLYIHSAPTRQCTLRICTK